MGSVTVTVRSPPPPSVQLQTSAATVRAGEPLTLTWNSADADECRALGGAAPDWSGTKARSGNQTFRPETVGAQVFSLACRNATAEVQADVQVQVDPALPPTATLTASPASVMTGDSFTLTWSSTSSTGCTAGGGAPGDGWTGGSALGTQGSRVLTVSREGGYTYSVQCQGLSGTASAQAGVTVTARSSSGGGGGGGVAGAELAGLLAALAWIRRRRDERRHGPR